MKVVGQVIKDSLEVTTLKSHYEDSAISDLLYRLGAKYGTYSFIEQSCVLDAINKGYQHSRPRPWRCWYCGCYCYDGKKTVCPHCNGPKVET